MSPWYKLDTPRLDLVQSIQVRCTEFPRDSLTDLTNQVFCGFNGCNGYGTDGGQLKCSSGLPCVRTVFVPMKDPLLNDLPAGAIATKAPTDPPSSASSDASRPLGTRKGDVAPSQIA